MAYDPTAPRECRRRAASARAEPAGLFTSDLSVNEFLLIRQAGFQPVGLVMGSSIYHIGFQLAQLRRTRS